jgi:hypothetical protein
MFDLNDAIRQFASDANTRTILVFIAADFVLGVCAAIATKEFRLSYVADFLRRDIFGKFLPYGALYILGKATTTDIVAKTGIDFAKVADGAFWIILAAIAASIIKSVAELGLSVTKGATDARALTTTNLPTNPVARALVAPEYPVVAVGEAEPLAEV